MKEPRGPGRGPKKKQTPEQMIQSAQTIEELVDAVKKIGPISRGWFKGKTSVLLAISYIKKTKEKAELGEYYQGNKDDILPYHQKYKILDVLEKIVQGKRMEVLGPVLARQREEDERRRVEERARRDEEQRRSKQEEVKRKVEEERAKKIIEDERRRVEDEKAKKRTQINNDLGDLEYTLRKNPDEEKLRSIIKEGAKRLDPFEEKYERYPDSEVAQVCAVLAYLYKNKPEGVALFNRAVDIYSKLILNEKNPLFYKFNIGKLFEAYDFFDEAFRYYDEVILQSHEVPEPEYFLRRSRMYFLFEDYNNALKDINNAIKASEKKYGKSGVSSGIYNARGLVFVKLGNFKKAREDFHKSVSAKIKDIDESIPVRNLQKCEELIELGPSKVGIEKKGEVPKKEIEILVDKVIGLIKINGGSLSYLDFVNLCHYYIDQNWPEGYKKDEKVREEIFKRIEQKLSKDQEIKNEGLVITEQEKREIIENIVSKLKIKYSFGEYKDSHPKDYVREAVQLLVEELKLKGLFFNSSLLTELLLKVIEDWALEEPIFAGKEIMASDEIQELRREIVKYHRDLTEHMKQIAKVTPPQTQNVTIYNENRNYSLIGKVKVDASLVTINNENNIDLDGTAQNVWEFLKKILGL
jgi:hypothetical protein